MKSKREGERQRRPPALVQCLIMNPGLFGKHWELLVVWRIPSSTQCASVIDLWITKCGQYLPALVIYNCATVGETKLSVADMSKRYSRRLWRADALFHNFLTSKGAGLSQPACPMGHPLKHTPAALCHDWQSWFTPLYWHLHKIIMAAIGSNVFSFIYYTHIYFICMCLVDNRQYCHSFVFLFNGVILLL